MLVVALLVVGSKLGSRFHSSFHNHEVISVDVFVPTTVEVPVIAFEYLFEWHEDLDEIVNSTKLFEESTGSLTIVRVLVIDQTPKLEPNSRKRRLPHVPRRIYVQVDRCDVNNQPDVVHQDGGRFR